MSDIVDKKFHEWTSGLDHEAARIEIYCRVRDIPYAVVPELIHPVNYARIMEVGKGSCSPKHFLLCNMFQRMGVDVLYAVYPFRWDAAEIPYTEKLRRLALPVGPGYHLACKVDIAGEFVLVDATLDAPLKKLGLRVNGDWDGRSNTLLPVMPSGDEELYHPSEAALMPIPVVDQASAAFYRELNNWLQRARNCS